MLNLVKDSHLSNPLLNHLWFMWFLVACLMGITGNSLVTFSKRTSTGRNYYLLETHLSHYSLWRFMCDQLLTQFILNTLIMLVIVTTGFVLGTIPTNLTLLISLVLLNVFGIYSSIIGFVVGILLDSSIIDAASAPLMIIVSLFIVPFKSFTAGPFVDLVTAIQKLFPGYYLYPIADRLMNNKNLTAPLLFFCLTTGITLIPFLAILWVKLIKKTR
ncbi:MAG: lantibiotic ABC transporter permease [Liquorilactobacillus satsumensis]